MAELNGGQITARQPLAAGVDTVLGVVGGPMIEAFAGATELGLQVINCRHEESAGFMASAWGYVNRKQTACSQSTSPNALTAAGACG